MRRADTRKMQAVARILRALFDQWPGHDTPNLDPEDIAGDRRHRSARVGSPPGRLTRRMMDIAIPVAPLGVLTLLGFFAPHAVGALNGALPFVKTAWQKKIVSVTVALVLAAIVVVFYYAITKEPITDWWLFALLAIVIVNASYALITRSSASAVERAADPNVITVHEKR